MEIIKPYKFRNLAALQLGKFEHRVEEYRLDERWVDIDQFNPKDYDNPSVVYAVSSLINYNKSGSIESDLYSKLKEFKNPFILILHTADQNFEEQYNRFLEIGNCKHIYTLSVNYLHDKLTPIPIGTANPVWKHGQEAPLLEAMKNLTKEKLLFYNFTISGGARDEYRPDCVATLNSKGIEMNKPIPQDRYFEELAKYKFCVCPPGNTLDCYRMWECLYLKVIPICLKFPFTEYFAKFFPIYLVEDWDEINLEELDSMYDELGDWKNYDLLDFNNYVNHFKIW